MFRYLKTYFFISCVVLLGSLMSRCHYDERAIVPESKPKVLDSTVIWLEISANFHKENYYATFEKYYVDKLAKKDYLNVLYALNAVAEVETYFESFSENFNSMLISFERNYGKKFHWSKKIFICDYKGNYFGSQTNYNKSIKEYLKVADYKPYDVYTYTNLAYLCNDLAFAYSATGKQEDALKYCNRALSYFEKVNDKFGIATVDGHLALIYLFSKKYEDAEFYFDQAIDGYLITDDLSNVYTTLHNKLILYDEINNPRKFSLIDSTYRTFITSGIDDESLELSLAAFYVEKLVSDKNFDRAKNVLAEMKILSENLNSVAANDEYQISLAQYEVGLGAGIKNIEAVEKTLVAVEASDHYQNQLAFYDVLKDNAVQKGNFKQALEYSEKEKVALSKLSSREMIAKTIALNKKYEVAKKEKKIALQQRNILNKNVVIALLVTSLSLFVLIALIVYYRQNQKKIKLENLRSAQYTKQLLNKTEDERKRIATDLHDSVSHELLCLKNVGFTSDANLKIDAIINDIRVISRNLHPVMFEKIGLIGSLEQLIERTQNHYNLMVSTEIDYHNFLTIEDELQLYRIFQEALTNTIKYADAFAAKITVTQAENLLNIEIRDNGKGFDVAQKLKDPSAFGIHNIIERSKAIGGQANFHSDQNGTIILIEIKSKA